METALLADMFLLIFFNSTGVVTVTLAHRRPSMQITEQLRRWFLLIIIVFATLEINRVSGVNRSVLLECVHHSTNLTACPICISNQILS